MAVDSHAPFTFQLPGVTNYYSMCNRASARANRLEIQPWRNGPSHVPESDFPHANSNSHHKVSMDLDCSTSPHLLISIHPSSFIFLGATRASLTGDHVAKPLTAISNSPVRWKASHVTRDGERRNCRAVELTHLHSIHRCTTLPQWSLSSPQHIRVALHLSQPPR
jgi:hypothetical protein